MEDAGFQIRFPPRAWEILEISLLSGSPLSREGHGASLTPQGFCEKPFFPRYLA